MARTGAEPLGSMGTDNPGRGALRSGPRMLFDYFQQLFAQVNQPAAWTPSREEVVTSLQGTVGPEGDLLNADRRSRVARSCCRSRSCATTSWPKLGLTSTPDQEIDGRKLGLSTAVVRCLYPVNPGRPGTQGGPSTTVRRQGVVGDSVRGARIIVLLRP